MSHALRLGARRDDALQNPAAQVSRTLPTWLFDLVGWGVLAATIALLLSSRFNHPAVPHDMGTIGQSAERVLRGELPHGDFDDPYTGLLSFVNAAAFYCFGVSATSTRLMLLFCSLLGFTLLYLLCRRVSPPWVAALVSTAAFVSSVPNYYCSMPTWYNLFCVTAALAAMSRFTATDRLRWIALAGACTGLSFLFKSVGLYFAAAAALYAIFHEQRRAETASAVATTAGRGCAWLTIAGMWAYVGGVALLLSSHPALPELFTYLAPAAVLVGYLSWNEYQLRFQESRARFVRLLKYGAVFFGGFGLVVGCYLIPYAVAGKVPLWLRGVFVRPLVRLDDERMASALHAAPLVGGAVLIVAFAAAAVAARKNASAARTAAVVAVGLFLLVLATCGFPEVYAAVWGAARLTPLAASIGLALALWSQRRAAGRKRRELVTDPALFGPAFLFVAAAAAFSLVQFPLAHGIYFLYAAPLVVLAGAYTLTALLPRSPVPTALFAGSIIAFASLWILPGHFVAFAVKYHASDWTTRISGQRCPIVCDTATARQYTDLIRSVAAHSTKGAPILALPDSPDVYFFTGRRNPTRTFFDAFDADYATPARDRRLLDVIERNKVDLVVLRNHIEFSPEGVSEEFYQELTRRFPHSEVITGGAYPKFMVRWRDRRPAGPLVAVAARTGK